MLLDARSDVVAEQNFRYHGGTQALLSYGSNSLSAIPHAHWDFLESCLPYYETDEYVFTHANYCWYRSMEEQTGKDLRWLSLEDCPPRKHLNGKTFILGHTPGKIRDTGFYRCLDTACGFGGPLTAMEIPTGKFWQVKEDGSVIA